MTHNHLQLKIRLSHFSGMCVVACADYESEEKRSKVMGVVLGSVALGVLLGYPTGGVLYSTLGKSAPFFFLSGLALVNLGECCCRPSAISIVYQICNKCALDWDN